MRSLLQGFRRGGSWTEMNSSGRSRVNAFLALLVIFLSKSPTNPNICSFLKVFIIQMRCVILLPFFAMLMHLFKDGFKAFASQPLDLLPRYLIPDSSKRFRPPHLYLGWLIDKSELFQYAQKQIPDAV